MATPTGLAGWTGGAIISLPTNLFACCCIISSSTGKGRGRVVKALTTTSMVDKMCAAYGLELTETGVGFKYIVAEMIKGGVLLGAEESGGIGFPGHIPERDGIAAGLMLLELLATERVSVNRLISNLVKQFGPHRIWAH